MLMNSIETKKNVSKEEIQNNFFNGLLGKRRWSCEYQLDQLQTCIKPELRQMWKGSTWWSARGYWALLAALLRMGWSQKKRYTYFQSGLQVLFGGVDLSAIHQSLRELPGCDWNPKNHPWRQEDKMWKVFIFPKRKNLILTTPFGSVFSFERKKCTKSAFLWYFNRNFGAKISVKNKENTFFTLFLLET